METLEPPVETAGVPRNASDEAVILRMIATATKELTIEDFVDLRPPVDLARAAIMLAEQRQSTASPYGLDPWRGSFQSY